MNPKILRVPAVPISFCGLNLIADNASLEWAFLLPLKCNWLESCRQGSEVNVSHTPVDV
jgi:hypothetical protein